MSFDSGFWPLSDNSGLGVLGFPTVKKDLGNGVTPQTIFEISGNFNFLKFSDFSIINSREWNSINSVIFAFIAWGRMVTTFTHRLSPPRIIFSTLIFTALDIFSFDEAAVQKVFTWWKPERDGQEENKLCFGRCWEKLPKVALIHPIHPRAVCMQYMPCTQTSTSTHTHKHKHMRPDSSNSPESHVVLVTNSPHGTFYDRWRSAVGICLCFKEDLWRRVAEFCNLSTYAQRSRTPGIVKCNNPLKLIKFGLV